MDNEIKIKVSADVSGLASLDSALASAQAQVKTAAQDMAQAQLAFGKAAEQGSEQAQAALAEYTAALKTAEDQLDSLEAAQARAKGVSLARPQAATPSTATSWRDQAATEAQKTGVSAAPQLAEEAAAAQVDAVAITELSAAKEAAAAAGVDLAAATDAETASKETATEQNAAFAESFERSTAAMAAYEKAAKGSAESATLLGKAFDEAIVSGAGLTEAMEAAVAAVNEFAGASERATTAASVQATAMDEVDVASSRSVSGSMAANGALRTLEGSMMGSTRAAAAFLSTTLGLGPVIAVAFPVIGAIALGSILVDVGEKFFEVQKAAEDAAGNIDESFEKATDAIHTANDTLLTDTDHLQGELDKLLGHPAQNGAKIAFDEMTESANQLSVAIDRDIEKMDTLISETNKKNTVGFWGSLLTGKAETADTQKLIQEQINAIQAKNTEYQRPLEMAEETGDKNILGSVQQAQMLALEKVYADADAKIGASLESLQQKQADFMETGFGEDQTARINMLTDALQMLAEQQKNIGEQYGRENVQQQVTAAQTAKAEAPAPVPEAKVGPSKIAEELKRQNEAAKRQVAEDQRTLDDLQEIDQKFVKAQEEAATAAQKAANRAEAAAAQHQHDQNIGGIQTQETKVENSQALGSIAPTKALEQLRTLHQQMTAEDERFIQEEMAIYAKEPTELDRLQKELDAAHQKGLEEQLRDTEKIVQSELQKWEQFGQQLTQDFNETINKFITTQQKPEQAFARMLDQMLSQAALFAEKWVEGQAEMWAKGAIQQALGMASQKAIQATTNAATISGDAAVAAAGAYAAEAGIPIVGPALAPAAAATAYASVMSFLGLAAFEAGGIVSGSSGSPVPIVAHAGERVLSAPQTQNFERMVNQPQAGGHVTNLNYHGQVNAFDRNGMRETLQSHAEDILGIVKQGWNQGKLR